MVCEQGSYEARLRALCPRGAHALVRYPLLHKFLNFPELVRAGATRALYVDCDTIFFSDVTRLFSVAHAHVVAREQVHSQRSHYGPDASCSRASAV
jgi:hypothetical protein